MIKKKIEDEQQKKTIFLEHSEEFDLIQSDLQYFSQGMWKDYSLKELGDFVHLLCKRAMHKIPSTPEKAIDDINDAKVYATIIMIIIESLKQEALSLCEVKEDLCDANKTTEESDKSRFVTEEDIKKRFKDLK